MSVRPSGSKKSQAALDFMASYGIAIIIITVAVAAVFVASTSNKKVFAQSCTGSSGFACGPYFLNSYGALNITLIQATGGDITIYGLACASTISGTTANELPGYGNVYVTSNTNYYPSGYAPGHSGNTIYTGSSATFLLYCYGAGSKATYLNESGENFIGYIWANFSLPGSKKKVTQLIATIDAEYTSGFNVPLYAEQITPNDPSSSDGVFVVTAHPIGGTPPYSYNWFVSTSGNPQCLHTNLISGESGLTTPSTELDEDDPVGSEGGSTTYYITYNVVDSVGHTACSAEDTLDSTPGEGGSSR